MDRNTDMRRFLQEKRGEIPRVASKHGAYNTRIFGSVVRGESGPDSHIDFLIDAVPTASSWFSRWSYSGPAGDFRPI
jgi:hypothetical protein